MISVFLSSYKWHVISNAVIALSVATNGVTTMMIAYKLWYVAMNETHMDPTVLTMKKYPRVHRMFILKTFGPRRRKSPGETILILLVESGLVYLGIQVSYLDIVLGDMPTQDPQSSSF